MQYDTTHRPEKKLVTGRKKNDDKKSVRQIDPNGLFFHEKSAEFAFPLFLVTFAALLGMLFVQGVWRLLFSDLTVKAALALTITVASVFAITVVYFALWRLCTFYTQNIYAQDFARQAKLEEEGTIPTGSQNRLAESRDPFADYRHAEEGRLRVEQALRESEARARAVVEAAADGIITIAPQGLIETFNPAAERLFGYCAAEILGANIKSLLPSPNEDEYDDYLQYYMRTGEKRGVGAGREAIGLRKDGAAFPVDLSVSEVRSGDQVRYIATIRDLTERKRLEEELLQAQKMESLGRLAGGVAHDFNNLLTVIMGYTELVMEEGLDSRIERNLMTIHQAAERATGLTGQLLAFARRQVIEPRVIDVNALMLNVDKILRRLIGEDVELVVLPKHSIGQVKVDPGQIEQVLLNLAINARDAMPDGGKLTIETDNVTLDSLYTRQHPYVQPGEYVMLAVSDTGVGMSEEIQMHIFEPFFTTKEIGRGTGLGLATCYGIVKQNGGHIWLYSEVGHGTTFKIYLPRVREAVTEPGEETQEPSAVGTETILLVEDEALVREFATEALRAQGYTVLEAFDGYEALRIANEHTGPIQLLLTDIVMPQMGGKVLAEHFSHQFPNVPVLFTSGYTDSTIVHHGVLGADVPFLQKPYTPKVLARKVREVLDNAAKPTLLHD